MKKEKRGGERKLMGRCLYTLAERGSDDGKRDRIV